jgi:hypothetical protein
MNFRRVDVDDFAPEPHTASPGIPHPGANALTDHHPLEFAERG